MTEERLKQINGFLAYLLEYDSFRYNCIFDFCDRRHIRVCEYIGRILDMSENSGKEPYVIIRNLFPDD